MQRILARIPYAIIATVCQDGQPWNSPVVARFDTQLNMYFVSWKKNQHSQNIARDQRIFTVVFDSRITEGQGLGLYMVMEAYSLETALAVTEACRYYDTRFFGEDTLHDGFIGDCPWRFYKAEPKKIWYNDNRSFMGHYVDIRKLISS